MIYFLGIAFIPCKAGVQSCSDRCMSHVVAEEEVPQEQEKEGTCSPLCACSCCGISSMISPKPIIWEEADLPAPYSTNTFNYTSLKGIFFDDSIWQPPRMI